MITHMHREISRLKDGLLELSAEVEKSISCAARALDTFDEVLAMEVIANDHRINDLEVNLEEDSLKILALYQPIVDSSETVIILIDFSFKFGYLLFSLSPNILHFITKVFKIVIELFRLCVIGLIVTFAHDLV